MPASEQGAITFVVKPRVHRDEIGSIDDVQRMLWLVEPEGGAPPRVIVVGRKRVAKRFWAFVADGNALGDRPERVAAGVYRIRPHDGHAHFEYELAAVDDDALRQELGIAPSQSFIASVMNPDPTLWESDELLFDRSEITIATPFPLELQAKFDDKRYVPLEPAFLDYPGAEIVLIAR